MKAALVEDGSLTVKDGHAKYVARVRRQLARVERADPTLHAFGTRLAVIELIERHRARLDPDAPYHFHRHRMWHLRRAANGV